MPRIPVMVERAVVKLYTSHTPNFEAASSSGTPLPRSAACSNRCRIASDFNRYAVSRSEAVSLQSAMGTMTAVGWPAASVTSWISASDQHHFTPERAS